MKYSLILLFIIALPLSAQVHGTADIGKNLDKGWYFTEINLEYSFNLWEVENDIYAGVKTFFLIDNFPWVSDLLRSIYTVGYELSYSIFYFGIDHFCSHPTISNYYEHRRLNNELWDSAGTDIKIGVRW